MTFNPVHPKGTSSERKQSNLGKHSLQQSGHLSNQLLEMEVLRRPMQVSAIKEFHSGLFLHHQPQKPVTRARAAYSGSPQPKPFNDRQVRPISRSTMIFTFLFGPWLSCHSCHSGAFLARSSIASFARPEFCEYRDMPRPSIRPTALPRGGARRRYGGQDTITLQYDNSRGWITTHATRMIKARPCVHHCSIDLALIV